MDVRCYDVLLSPGLVSRAVSVYLEDLWLLSGQDSSFRMFRGLVVSVLRALSYIGHSQSWLILIVIVK